MLSIFAAQSTRCTRALVATYASRRTPALARALSSESSDVDIKLQAEFNNKWNRIRAIWGVLAKSERDEMERLLDEGVLQPNMLDAIMCYTDLKNPLLHKYNFDYKDFLTGAKFACLAVDESLFSRQFFDFVNGKSAESENAAYLQSLLHPRLYNELKNVVHGHNISDEQLDAERSIPRLSMTRVATRVVQSEGANDPLNYIPDHLAKEDAENFPAGSVIASVFVDAEVQWDNKETRNSWVRKQALVFDGCISEHVPCDWAIRQLVSTIPIPRGLLD